MNAGVEIRLAGESGAGRIARLLPRWGIRRAGAHAFHRSLGYEEVCHRSGRFMRAL